jgi:hypothetical protein
MALAPWPARAFVIAFTVAIAVCGALSIEAWPLTGWRLFSHERHRIAAGWMATSVDAHGAQTPIAFARFPSADRHFLSIMRTYRSLPADEQEAICQAWARLVRRQGASTAGGLRLYATTRDMRLHVGHPEPVTPTARLRWTCADGHGARRVQAAGGVAAGAAVNRVAEREATARAQASPTAGRVAADAAVSRVAEREATARAQAGAAAGRGAVREPRGVGR